MSESWYVENVWPCSACGRSNRGRDKSCAGCGQPKGQAEEDAESIPDGAEPVGAAREAQAAAGPDWTCRYCGSKAPSGKDVCARCGASKVYMTAACHGAPATRERAAAPLWPGRSAKTRPRLRRALAAFAVAVVIGLGVGSLFWLFVPREASAKVASRTWIYTSILRQKTLAHGEGWGHRDDAFNVACDRRLKGYERCRPHDCNPHSQSYSCRPHSCNCATSCSSQRNGFSKCSRSCSTCYDTCYRTVYDTCWDSCPVYGDWCVSDWYEWPQVKRAVSSGHGDDAAWPALDAAGPDQRLDRSEDYKVVFAAGEKSWTVKPLTLAEYRRFATTSRWRLRFNGAGSCQVLAPDLAEAAP